MKKEIIGSLLFAVILFSGCSRSASPQAYNGQYYMTGDSNCRSFRQISSDRIMCYDSDEKQIGWRQAMSDKELQMHMYQKAQNDKASQDLARQMNETGLKMQEIYAPKNYNVNVYRY